MRKYLMSEIDGEEYTTLVLGTSFEGLFEQLSEIEQVLREKRKRGWIVLDSLLKTGGSDNRFCGVYFDGDKIVKSTARNIAIPRNNTIRCLSTSLLKNNPDILSFSILTDQQKKLVQHGVVI